MAACLPLPSHTDQDSHLNLYKSRIARATNTRRQPNFLFLLGQFFGQTVSDTNRALGNITRIFNNQFTTTTPSPDMVTSEDDSNSTTEATPPPLSRQQLFKILGNNYRGLVRLFNTEWQSAVQQSSKNVAMFRKELREAVRPYFSPNRNLSSNEV